MALGKHAAIIEGNYRTFQEEVAGALDNKEYHLLEPGTADNSVKLNTGLTPIGTLHQKLQNATGEKDDVNVRLLSGSGTTKMIQNAAIAYGAFVMPDSTAYTRVKAVPGTTGTYRAIARKVSQGGGAAGDVIEVETTKETIVVP